MVANLLAHQEKGLDAAEAQDVEKRNSGSCAAGIDSHNPAGPRNGCCPEATRAWPT
jgi:hypothetical protein